MKPYELRLAEAAICEESLSAFIRCAWHVLFPRTPLVWGRHIDAICEHLEALSKGDIRQLLINMPPRHLKSGIVSKFWPAWMWIHSPQWKQVHASYDNKLALRDMQSARSLLESDWFQTTFQPLWRFADDQNVKSFYKNTASGYRIASSKNAASSTGWGGDNLCIDDPLKAASNPTRTELESVIDWYTGQFENRAENPNTVTRLVIGQRVHENDLSGFLIENFASDWVHLNLMMEFDEHKKCITDLGASGTWEDWRTEPGQLLFPEFFKPEDVEKIKGLDAQRWTTQYQQDPKPQAGNMFTPHHIGFWFDPETMRQRKQHTFDIDGNRFHYREKALPSDDGIEIQSWDMSFKGSATSDFVVGQYWRLVGTDFFLLDQHRGKHWFTECVDAVRTFRAKHPTNGTLIEDKANGSAIIDVLKQKIAGIVPVNPRGGKITRAQAVLPLMSTVWLPHPDYHPWVWDFVAEIMRFPLGKHDDQADAMTQALSYLNQFTSEITQKPEVWVL